MAARKRYSLFGAWLFLPGLFAGAGPLFLTGLFASGCQAADPQSAEPQSQVADPVVVAGPQTLLVVAVRFPGTSSGSDLNKIKRKAEKVGRYIRAASYGKAWLKPRVAGWYDMPAPLTEYRVSPYNFQVDRGRVRRLLADALDAARRDVELKDYRFIWIVAGAPTRPDKGYGMIAYCANPGMLSGVRRGRTSMVRVDLAGGGSFAGPAIVSAENAHAGHVVHDLLHAFGGASGGKRAVPDLYDYELQSDPDVSHTSPAPFAIHAGPWDIMSQHFVERHRSPPRPSSFTLLQLGWIGRDRVVTVRPGETREVTLAPINHGRGILAVRVPLDAGRSLLLENRRSVWGKGLLKAKGLLVLDVDRTRAEGTDIVRVADANPGVGGLMAAPFRPGAGERRFYENRVAGVAVAPLAAEPNGDLRIVITTPERIKAFLPVTGLRK